LFILCTEVGKFTHCTVVGTFVYTLYRGGFVYTLYSGGYGVYTVEKNSWIFNDAADYIYVTCKTENCIIV
jgi:hypothetical protein